ncbi:hypothetical protein Misp01_62540 [Microtetraspora sp. NBRC 13810]|uniref:hypothetical protein n=1 Tax=Microtetraspora sp. NBRC 13810 TaxID=3030990 RepID=UPI0024A2A855|nr:hypothetical protein [Microtetraspora sp. NBRC 13810]GLW11126.1 hypothetical protein Misp01_62540 [Microtetraspora sp. NBRC 13810]
MLDALTVPLLVTTDLPPGADLAEFGELLAGAVRTLRPQDSSYPGCLYGRTFWLDRPSAVPGGDGAPRPVTEDLRFAAMLGFLSTAESQRSAKEMVSDARSVITDAVTGRYGDLASPPAVMAIRSEDVRERAPKTAVVTITTGTLPELAAISRSYL